MRVSNGSNGCQKAFSRLWCRWHAIYETKSELPLARLLAQIGDRGLHAPTTLCSSGPRPSVSISENVAVGGEEAICDCHVSILLRGQTIVFQVNVGH